MLFSYMAILASAQASKPSAKSRWAVGLPISGTRHYMIFALTMTIMIYSLIAGMCIFNQEQSDSKAIEINIASIWLFVNLICLIAMLKKDLWFLRIAHFLMVTMLIFEYLFFLNVVIAFVYSLHTVYNPLAGYLSLYVGLFILVQTILALETTYVIAEMVLADEMEQIISVVSGFNNDDGPEGDLPTYREATGRSIA